MIAINSARLGLSLPSCFNFLISFFELQQRTGPIPLTETPNHSK